MKEFSAYYESFNNSLKEFVNKNPSKGLYSPINYLLNLGGKRLRPILVLLSADAFGKKYKKAIPAALAVEIFHNFTLMHDDIMDEAPLRRGKLTVHKKWNLNSGILSGDAMLIQVYQILQGYDSENLKKLLLIINKTALEVCEGQQYDLDFETQANVTQNQYLEMIRLKTAVLVGCSLKMGAIIGGASKENAKMIYDYGVSLGIAFQIQDDYLDVFGDANSFGKQIGGDIVENKKTILYHQSMDKGSKKEQKQLQSWFSTKTQKKFNHKKIKEVKKIFEITGAKMSSLNLVEKYTKEAFKKLNDIKLPEESKKIFETFGLQLMDRKF